MLADEEALCTEIAAHLDDDRRGERVRSGLVFAVAGAPNVGKSSLVNALAGRDVAIVSPVPGTTRDAVEARIVLGGVPVTLVDTAGLHATSDAIEAEGIRRARARAAEADLVLAVHEAGGGPAIGPEALPAAENVLAIANKVDRAPASPDSGIAVSALTGCGLDGLRRRLEQEARRLTERAGPPPLTRARHRSALSETLARLQDAARAKLPELRGEDFRLALRSLGRVTGHVGIEEVLDEVFGKFCIGK
jgi:tRNA modification GTPase